jgi:hypothetical protein
LVILEFDEMMSTTWSRRAPSGIVTLPSTRLPLSTSAPSAASDDISLRSEKLPAWTAANLLSLRLSS